MTDVSFYHLQRESLDTALPKLLEKVVERGLRAVVLAGSEARVEHLNDVLWTYSADSFLPHGSARDGQGNRQPVYLTQELETPNGATVLVIVDSVGVDDLAAYDRCLYMFDGNSDEALGQARQRWKAYKDQGCDVTYWQQGERGWEKKA